MKQDMNEERIAELEKTIKALEEKCARTEEFYMALIAHAAETIAILDSQGIITFEAPAVEKLIGYTPEEIVGTSVFDHIHPDDLAIAREERLPELIDNPGVPIKRRIRVRHKDGSWRTIEGWRVNLLDNPAVRGIVLNYRDVTEQVRAEEAVQHRIALEELVASISASFIDVQPAELAMKMERALAEICTFGDFDSCNVILYSRDLTNVTTVSEWHREGMRTMGTESVGLAIEDFSWPLKIFESGQILQIDSVRAMPDEGKTLQELLMALGTQSFIGIPLFDEGDFIGSFSFQQKRREKKWSDEDIKLLRIMSGIFASVISRNRATEELRKNERFFRRITENMHDLIVEVDKEFRRTYVSPSYERLLGYRHDEVVGHSVFEHIHPDDIDQVVKYARAIIEHQNKQPKMLQYRVKKHDGSYVWLESISGPLFDDKGAHVGGTVWARDVTERRKFEEEIRQLNAELEQRVAERTAELAKTVEELNDEIQIRTTLEEKLGRKNRELEDFAYTVGHELKNSLLIIYKIGELSQNHPELLPRNITQLIEISDRLIGFIDTLLELARAGKAIDSKVEIDVAGLVREIFELLKPVDMKIELVIQDSFPSILCAPFGMEQVFTNLLTNCFKHQYGNKESLVIELGFAELENSMRISLKDNGIGIDREELDEIFNGTYPSRKKGLSGLGLKIVKKIVEAHGGVVSAESEGKGRGVTFNLDLPCQPGNIRRTESSLA
jgi:PAS domain S-box-containing protein